MAYDADSGDGTVYEYNFSRQNEGGCVMFCLQEAIHNTFRHNVSFDDLGGTISPSENPDALIADNVSMCGTACPSSAHRWAAAITPPRTTRFCPWRSLPPE